MSTVLQSKNKTSWNYEWSFEENPVVRFNNQRVKMDAIFTLEQLQHIVMCTDEDNSFIPVPRSVMDAALADCDKQLKLAA